MLPSVSVVIPIYNRGPKIVATLDSVLKQDINPDQVEIIIIDDGSTDDTLNFLRGKYSSDQRIRLFSIPNGGVANARNFGLEKAQGEFISYLDHDDLWLPEKLRLQVEKIRTDDNVGVMYCNWLSVDEEGKAMPASQQLSQQEWWHPKEGDIFPWILLPHRRHIMQNPIVSMTIPLIRTQVLRNVGGFDASTVPCDDWDLWIRLSQVTQFMYVPRVMVHYVMHEGQQHKNQRKAIDSTIRLIRKHSGLFKKNVFMRVKFRELRKHYQLNINYLDAKNALVEGETVKLKMLWVETLLKAPIYAINKRWIYLIWRALKRDRRPY